MKSILCELYYGNIDPASLCEPLLKEHRNFLRRKFDCLDTLGEGFDKDNPQLKKVFDEVLNFAFIEASWDTSNAFIQGFSLAVKMMSEAYALDLSAKED